MSCCAREAKGEGESEGEAERERVERERRRGLKRVADRRRESTCASMREVERRGEEKSAQVAYWLQFTNLFGLLKRCCAPPKPPTFSGTLQ